MKSINYTDAITLLNQGDVVALPTETVYGLAARLDRPEAIKKIFEIKKRPTDNPLIVHVSNIEMAKSLITCSWEKVSSLAAEFWPGPLTLILPANLHLVCETVRAHHPTVAIRMPAHPLISLIIDQVGPLVAPSANLSGRPSATRPSHVAADFGPDFPIVDGGPCLHGVESTILALVDGKWVVARQGAISQEELCQILSLEDAIVPQGICPGQRHRHYAPKCRLLCGIEEWSGQSECVLGFEDRHYKGSKQVFILGSLNTPSSILPRLFALLRGLDDEGITTAWVDCRFEPVGPLRVVKERLLRACEI